MTEDALKARLSARGVRVPVGAVVTAGDAGALPDIATPVMVKGLVPLTDRAKRGLVVRAESASELRGAVDDLLGLDVEGHRVARVLVEALAEPGTEHYLATAFDYVRGKPVLLFGAGGSGIEHREPPQILPLSFVDENDFTSLPEPLRPVAVALTDEFRALRAKLIELNPVRVVAGEAIVLDAKASLDPTLPAPPDAVAFAEVDEHDARLQALAASLKGGTEVRFGRLDGTIGLISAGGGVLAVVHDALRRHGLRPANFADVSGGSATTELLGAVAREVLTLRPEGILIATGITSSITVTGFAEAMLAALSPLKDDPGAAPVIVARMAGPGEEEAVDILAALPHCVTVGKDVAVDEAVDILAREVESRRRS